MYKKYNEQEINDYGYNEATFLNLEHEYDKSNNAYMTTFLISCLVAVVVSFLCSLTEAVLLSLNPVKIETDKAKGLRYAGILDNLRSHVNRPISAILILNTVAHTGGATVAGSSFGQLYGDEYLWIFSTVFTLVILFGTEILPKVIGVSFTGSLAKHIAVPLKITILILHPFIYVTELFTKLIIRRKDTSEKYSLEDIQSIARVAKLENIITKDQEDIIVKTATLRNRKIEEIMLPIKNVIFFHHDISSKQYFSLAEKFLHTRYPVSRSGSPQDIYGYLNFKEIALQTDISNDDLHRFIRPILFLKYNVSIIQALKQLNMMHHHLAIVQNMRGENIGMITLENVVEEIVGKIADEFDIE